MHETNLKPNYRNFDRNGPLRRIAKPDIIGYFSVDRNRQFIPDFSNCKYLKLPPSNEPIQFDLNKGYEVVEHKPDSVNEEKLNHILNYILLNLKKLMAEMRNEKYKFLKPDIICFRGKLRMLMCTPYEFRDGWSLLVTKFKGNIYICGFETDEEKDKRHNQTEQSKKICSYGFKFEQYVMSGELVVTGNNCCKTVIEINLLPDSPTSDPNTDDAVLESEEFCCMFSTKLDGTSILFGAEMDGIESDSPIELSKVNWNDLRFTEVKVCLKPSNRRQFNNFYRFKTRNWWCQSYLTNVQRIVVGHRTETGIVDEIESMYVHDLEKMSQVRLY